MLTPRPGAASGLAGVQIAASSFIAKMRQLGYPATLTPIPTNLGNQDHVPMALNGATAGAETIRLGWLVLGSLALAVQQLDRLDGEPAPEEPRWAELWRCLPPLDTDQPLAGAVREAADRLRGCFLPPVRDRRADATPWVRSDFLAW